MIGDKQLSALANSLSLPYPDKGGRDVWLAYGSPTGYVASSDGICERGEAAGYTGEKGLRLTIGLRNEATLRASARGISGVNQLHDYPGEPGFILDKLPQLTERPGVLLSPLCFPNRDAVSDMGEVFKGDTPTAVFSLSNNTPTDNVIGVGSKTLLFLGAFSEKSLSLLRAIGLKFSTKFSVAFSKSVDLPTRVNLAIRVGNYIHNTQVKTKKLGGVTFRGFLNLAGLEKVEDSIPVDKVSLTGKILEEFQLPIAGREGNSQPSVKSPDRDEPVGNLPREDTLVIGDAPMTIEYPLSGTPRLVSISDLCQYPDHYLGRKVKPVAEVVVKKMMQVVLLKDLGIPSMFTDIVGRIVNRLQSRKQSFMLFFGRLQLNLGNQLHARIIAYSSRLEKKGGKPASPCQLKQAVSYGWLL